MQSMVDFGIATRYPLSPFARLGLVVSAGLASTPFSHVLGVPNEHRLYFLKPIPPIVDNIENCRYWEGVCVAHFVNPNFGSHPKFQNKLEWNIVKIERLFYMSFIHKEFFFIK